MRDYIKPHLYLGEHGLWRLYVPTFYKRTNDIAKALSFREKLNDKIIAKRVTENDY